MAKNPFVRKPLPSEEKNPPKTSPPPESKPEPRTPRTISEEPMTYEVAKYELTQMLRNFRAVNYTLALIEKGEQAEKLLMEKDQALAALEKDIERLTAAKAETIQREQREAKAREESERKRLEESLASLNAQVTEARRQLAMNQEAAARVEQEARQQTLTIQERGKANLAEIEKQIRERKAVLATIEADTVRKLKAQEEMQEKHLEEERSAAARLQSIKDEIDSVRNRVASLG